MTGRVAAAGIAAIAAAAVVTGLLVIESPSEARARRLDERRASDLDQLARDVDVFQARRGRLPATIDDLAGEPTLGRQATDPASGERYEYRALDAGRFELCATFGVDSGQPPWGIDRQFASHGPGRQCFTVTVREAGARPGGR
jgi:hypothetical protein